MIIKQVLKDKNENKIVFIPEKYEDLKLGSFVAVLPLDEFNVIYTKRKLQRIFGKYSSSELITRIRCADELHKENYELKEKLRILKNRSILNSGGKINEQ